VSRHLCFDSSSLSLRTLADSFVLLDALPNRPAPSIPYTAEETSDLQKILRESETLKEAAEKMEKMVSRVDPFFSSDDLSSPLLVFPFAAPSPNRSIYRNVHLSPSRNLRA